MKRYLFVVTLLFGVLGAPAVVRADITYNVDVFVGAYSIVGDIVTDGTMGALNTIDIDSFSFGIQNAGNSSSTGGSGSTAREMGKGSGVDVVGDDLMATSTNLTYNLNDLLQSALLFQNTDGFEWCIFTDEGCDPAGSGELLNVLGSSTTLTNLSGDMVIGTVGTAPEPGVFGLTLIGMIGLAFAVRKRGLQALRLGAGA